MSYFDKIEILARHRFAIHEKIKAEVPNYQDHFIHLCRSRRSTLRNPNKLKIREFTIFALDKILTSIALSTDENMQQNLLTIIMKNYKMDQDTATDLLEECMILYENENIKSLYKEMKKYTEGLLLKYEFKDVLEIFRRHLKPSYYEKKNMGEVFTPFICICIILERIPDYVWENPNSTFFDPSAGMGGFLVIIYHRLMNSLSHVFINRKERHEHIIKNMLFAAELDASNVAMMRRIFGNGLHIFHGDTITQFNVRRHFGINNFTVVVGNPPFEKSQQKETRKNAGDSLWPDFVTKSFSDWLAPNGYFAMLLPPGWRKPSDDKSRTKDLWKVMSRDNTVQWIKMYDAYESKKVFDGHVSIRFDLVVVMKQKSEYRTIIECTDKKTYQKSLYKIPYLPNGRLNGWCKLFSTKGPKCNVFNNSIYDSRKSNIIQKIKNTEFKYPVIHSIHKNGEPVYLYTNKKDKDGGFGVPKVIFNCLGGWNAPILDLEGKYGLSQDTFALVVDTKQEGLAIKKYFTPERLAMWGHDLNWATSVPRIFWKLFRDIPKNFYNL
jgi:N-6 DNA Methylase